MADSDNIVIRSKKRLLALFGIKSSLKEDIAPTKQIDAAVAINAGTFSDSELAKLPSFKDTDKSKQTMKDIENILSTVADRNQSKTIEARSFKALTPEIGKARSILIPSIMSPNDIQDDHIIVSVDVDELTPAVNTKLSAFLQNYFNEELELGVKISGWIGDAMFETGATPVLVLPKRAIRILDKAIDAEERLIKEGKVLEVGTEGIRVEEISSAKSLISTETLQAITTVDEKSTKSNTSVEALSIYSSLKAEIEEELTEYFGATDKLGTDVKHPLTVAEIATEGIKNVGDMLGKYKNGMSFSTDYRSIIAPSKRRKTVTDTLYKQIQETIYGSQSQRMMVLGMDEDVEEGDHPTLIELSSDCVIPVTIPG
jgi:hypothetical protein